MSHWERYLYETHSEDTLRQWAKQMRLFRFVRAIGGHANDDEQLQLRFRLKGDAAIEDFCNAIGIKLKRFSVEPPQPVYGVSYPIEEFEKFPFLIPNTLWLEQPGRCKISGNPVYVWFFDNSARITIANDGFDVNELDVVRATQIEDALTPIRFERIDPPVDWKHCICPKYYPDFFD